MVPHPEEAVNPAQEADAAPHEMAMVEISTRREIR